MSLFSYGLKFAGWEHRWEQRTNTVLLVGILVTTTVYYYDLHFTWIVLLLPSIGASELGLFFLILAGITHLFARIAHTGEQTFLKNSRGWKK